jgi:hypothetical protein
LKRLKFKGGQAKLFQLNGSKMVSTVGIIPRRKLFGSGPRGEIVMSDVEKFVWLLPEAWLSLPG